MDIGVKSPNITRSDIADSVLVNRNGSTRQIPVASLAKQLAGTSPISLIGNQSPLFKTRANLLAATLASKTTAWVYDDTTVAYNGIWRWTGSAWEWSLPLPYSFINATNAGAGTPNAIQAITDIPVSEATLIILPIAQTNTASPVRVSYNGGSLLTIKSNNGNDIVIGGLAAGMHVTGVIVGDVFQLVSDQISAAIAAAAEASAQASQASANNAATQVTNAKSWSDQAQAYAQTANPINFVPIRTNLCPNGGFEDGLDGIAVSGSGAVSSDLSVNYSPIWGARLVISNVSAATTRVITWPKFTAGAGETYTFSGDAILFATSGQVYYQMVWYDAAGTATFSDRTILSPNVNFSDTAAGRQRWAKSVTAPTGTVSAALRLVFDALVGATVLQARQAKVEYGQLPASFYSPYVKLFTIASADLRVEAFGISTSNTAAQNDIGWAKLKAYIESLSTGATIRFGRGVYRFTYIIWPGKNNVHLLGAGDFNGGTVLEFASTSTYPHPIVINAVHHSKLTDVYIRLSTKVGGESFAIVVDGGAYRTRIERVRIDYAYNGIWVSWATETLLRDVEYRYLLGNYGTLYGRHATGRCYGLTLDNVSIDNPYRAGLDILIPYRVPSNARVIYKNWQPSFTYAVGEVVIANGCIWQCTTAGTSGTAFTSSIPGATPTEAFTSAVSDGGNCVWAFIANASLTGCVQDSHAYTMRVDKVVCLNGSQGLAMRDSLNTGSSYPMWCDVIKLECDHNHAVGVNLEGGEGFYSGDLWVGSCLTGNGMTVGSNFRGEVHLGPATRIHGNAQHGFLSNAGPKSSAVHGAQASNNSQENFQSYHGFTFASGSTDFSVIGCGSGASAQLQISQGYGIFIGNGCSRGRVALNRTGYNLLGGVSEGTGHTDVQFLLN